jgi:hypothetical protein
MGKSCMGGHPCRRPIVGHLGSLGIGRAVAARLWAQRAALEGAVPSREACTRGGRWILRTPCTSLELAEALKRDEHDEDWSEAIVGVGVPRFDGLRGIGALDDVCFELYRVL